MIADHPYIATALALLIGLLAGLFLSGMGRVAKRADISEGIE